MGFIQAFKGALSGSFANQWLEYMVPAEGMSDHVALAKAVPNRVAGSENNDGEESAGVISDGSKFFVPEGTCLIVLENGAITAVMGEAGGYEYHAQDLPEAKSFFAKDGFFASTFGQSWNQFKFGGQPGNQQVAFYVNLKAMSGFRYGTRNPIRYKDANYNNAMLAVTSNGTYSLQIVDPILFVKNFVPAEYLTLNGPRLFSLDAENVSSDANSNAGNVQDRLFMGFIGSLGAALSAYTKGGKSIDDIQGGTVEFAQAVDEAVEATYQWGSQLGIKIASVEPGGLDWDQPSVDLINKFNTGMLMQGTVGQAYSQTQIAEGLNAAGNNGGANGMFGVGMAAGMTGMGGAFNGPAGQNPVAGAQPQQPQQPQQPMNPQQ